MQMPRYCNYLLLHHQLQQQQDHNHHHYHHYHYHHYHYHSRRQQQSKSHYFFFFIFNHLRDNHAVVRGAVADDDPATGDANA